MTEPTPIPFFVPSITKSPYFDQPHKFLRLGQRVRAKITVEEEGPGTDSFVHAVPGEEGVCVGVDEGFWPTVRFDRTGTATCVTDEEVVALPLA